LVAIPRTRWRGSEEVGSNRRDAAAFGALLIFSAALVAFFLTQEIRLGGVLGMPLDDAWIHFRIAENFRDGAWVLLQP